MTTAQTANHPQTGRYLDADLYRRNLAVTFAVVPRLDPKTRLDLLDQLRVSDRDPQLVRERAAAVLLAQMATQTRQDLWTATQRGLREMKASGSKGWDCPFRVEGSGKKKKKRKWGPFRRVQAEIGRGLRRAGKEVKRWSKVPAVGNVLGAMGTDVLGETLVQAGNVMHGGSVKDWDDRAWVASAGKTFTSAGRALVMASAWLPPPYNVAALAIGTASMAVGGALTQHVEAKEAAERAAKAETSEETTAPEYTPEAEFARIEEGDAGTVEEDGAALYGY